MIAPRRRNLGRLLVLAALAGIVAFLPARALSLAIPALSPFVAVSTLLATRRIGWFTLCALPVLILAYRRRRAFCLHLCPMGLVLDTCGRLRRRKVGAAYARVPAFGYWAALFTIGGALVACPLLLALDPIGILAGALGGAQPPLSPGRLDYAGGFAALVALSMAFPALWCRRLCPLGGAQDVLADVRASLSRRPERKCAPLERRGVARRVFLGLGIGATASGLGVSVPAGDVGGMPLRPPGAIDAPFLKALCLRCGHCVNTCPTGIIRPSASLSDPAGLLTPILDFSQGHCLDSCNRCGLGCPSGAITGLSLERKNAAVIGLAAIDQNACLLREGKECVACITTCERQAVEEVFSQESYELRVTMNESRCNGCGACVRACPGHAITVKAARP